MGTAAVGIAQKEDREEGIDQQDIFDGVVFLLPACLTDKSEVCSPKSPFVLVFFLGNPFLEEDCYGEHTLSL